MNELSADGFVDFFQALWSEPGKSRSPFAWQKALVSRLLQDPRAPWPQAIALPTAAGKTTCIDIALYVLAASCRIENGVALASAPRRIFFVVDRRVIVDEAYDRAHKLAESVGSPERDGIAFEDSVSRR